MAKNPFDPAKAKKNLEVKELISREDNEKMRLQLVEKTLAILKQELSGHSYQVFLIGSITVPYAFTKSSDIDIVVKNFTGDRFDLWTRLESLLGRTVEVIIYENCHFQDHVDKEGLKVL